MLEECDVLNHPNMDINKILTKEQEINNGRHGFVAISPSDSNISCI